MSWSCRHCSTRMSAHRAQGRGEARAQCRRGAIVASATCSMPPSCRHAAVACRRPGLGVLEWYHSGMKRSEPITTTEYTYTILLTPEPEGGFTVTCPSLPGLVTYGETLEEARAMAAEAPSATSRASRRTGCRCRRATRRRRPSPSTSASSSRRYEPAAAGDDGARYAPCALRAGFYVHHVKGSHHSLRHPDRPELRVVAPVHKKDLPPGAAEHHQAGRPLGGGVHQVTVTAAPCRHAACRRLPS